MNFQAKDSWTTILVQSDTTTHDKPKKAKKATAASASDTTHAGTVQSATASPNKAKADEGVPWFSLGVTALFFIFIIVFITRLIKRVFKKIRGDVEEADYTVPHCNFAETPEGFKVTFRRAPIWLQRGFFERMQANQNTSSGGGLAAGFGLIIGMLISTLLVITVGVLYWVWLLIFPTKVEITKDLVLIAGKKLRRADFGNFNVDHTRQLPGKDDAVAQLGYSYGRRNFTFGGGWRERDANEVASALNSHLRSVPKAGDEHNPSPAALRQAIQSDEAF